MLLTQFLWLDNRQRIDLKNIQAAPAAQFQKNK